MSTIPKSSDCAAGGSSLSAAEAWLNSTATSIRANGGAALAQDRTISTNGSSVFNGAGGGTPAAIAFHVEAPQAVFVAPSSQMDSAFPSPLLQQTLPSSGSFAAMHQFHQTPQPVIFTSALPYGIQSSSPRGDASSLSRDPFDAAWAMKGSPQHHQTVNPFQSSDITAGCGSSAIGVKPSFAVRL